MQFNPDPVVDGKALVFPSSSATGENGVQTKIPLFDASQDADGAASHVPYMDHFYDNSLQTGLMRDLAIDLELLGEHVVLLGNQVRHFSSLLKILSHNICNRVWGRTKSSIGGSALFYFIIALIRILGYARYDSKMRRVIFA